MNKESHISVFFFQLQLFLGGGDFLSQILSAGQSGLMGLLSCFSLTLDVYISCCICRSLRVVEFALSACAQQPYSWLQGSAAVRGLQY